MKNEDRLQRLTPRQKDCLRLVARGLQSKSIARELGISPLRVDKHISDSRKILGVSDRAEAARLLGVWEQQGMALNDAWPRGAPLSGLPSTPDLLSNSHDDDAEDSMVADALMLGTTRKSFRNDNGGTGSLELTSPPGRRRDNNLGISWSVALLVALAAFIVAAGSIASLLLSLSQSDR